MNALHLQPKMPEPSGIFTHDFGDTAAVLTFHVQKRTGGERTEWVPVLKEAEYLVGMNFWRVGEGKFKDSFGSLIVRAEAPPRLGLSPRRDWSTRLNGKYQRQGPYLLPKIQARRGPAPKPARKPVLRQTLANNIPHH